MDSTEVRRLSVNIYQLADDQLFKSARTDGSGWDWSWADWERDWMSATPYPERLPLLASDDRQSDWVVD